MCAQRPIAPSTYDKAKALVTDPQRVISGIGTATGGRLLSPVVAREFDVTS